MPNYDEYGHLIEEYDDCRGEDETVCWLCGTSLGVDDMLNGEHYCEDCRAQMVGIDGA